MCMCCTFLQCSLWWRCCQYDALLNYYVFQK
uniref:Uncharacterized protein n=1 Tax=Rhizophora mucronata TaxID=61149 RepID=A0A2P2NIU6_RHIMU